MSSRIILGSGLLEGALPATSCKWTVLMAFEASDRVSGGGVLSIQAVLSAAPS